MLILTSISFHYKAGVKEVTDETPVAYINPEDLENTKQELKMLFQDTTEQICTWTTYTIPTASNVKAILQNEDKDTLLIIYQLPKFDIRNV